MLQQQIYQEYERDETSKEKSQRAYHNEAISLSKKRQCRRYQDDVESEKQQGLWYGR